MNKHKKPVCRTGAAGPRVRRCLMCGNTFPSEGPHNHICKRCKGRQAWRDGAALADRAS